MTEILGSQPLSPLHLTPEQLMENELFREVATLIDQGSFPEISDAQFYIRKDGLIVNAEGWFHPPESLIGEPLYSPDNDGDRTIFGNPYRKLTLFPGTHTPIPYEQRNLLLKQYDPSLDQRGENPYFATYKQIFPRSDFMAYIPGKDVFKRAVPRLLDGGHEVGDDIAAVSSLLELGLHDISLGFTGAPSFGDFDELHDLDLVFSGSLEENKVIAGAMRKIVRTQPERRLMEGGKGWNIRFFNDRGMLICNFFAYKDVRDAPLRDFEMEVVLPDVIMEGEVVNDLHSVYTPTVLDIDDVQILRHGDKKSQPLNEPLKLIAYHTASRGECFEGDRVRAHGALVQISTPSSRYLGICVIEREGIRNLTPAWEGFYQDDEITQSDRNYALDLGTKELS